MKETLKKTVFLYFEERKDFQIENEMASWFFLEIIQTFM